MNDEELRAHLSDKYHISILNPEQYGEMAYSMQYVYDVGFEMSIISWSNGVTVMNSVHQENGSENAIELDGRFFDAIAYSYHHCMALMTQMSPRLTEEETDGVIESYYKNDAGVNQVTPCENWLIHSIVQDMLYREEPAPPEYAELYEYVNRCTKFGVPDVREMPEHLLG